MSFHCPCMHAYPSQHILKYTTNKHETKNSTVGRFARSSAAHRNSTLSSPLPTLFGSPPWSPLNESDAGPLNQSDHCVAVAVGTTNRVRESPPQSNALLLLNQQPLAAHVDIRAIRPDELIAAVALEADPAAARAGADVARHRVLRLAGVATLTLAAADVVPIFPAITVLGLSAWAS